MEHIDPLLYCRVIDHSFANIAIQNGISETEIILVSFAA